MTAFFYEELSTIAETHLPLIFTVFDTNITNTTSVNFQPQKTR